MKSAKTTNRSLKTLSKLPVTLCLALSLLVGCSGSNLKKPEANSVTVDESLMVTPNYTERLVKLLSE